MAAYWLVSAPGDPRPEDTWGLIKEKTGGVSVNHKFNIPDLKVSLYKFTNIMCYRYFVVCSSII